MSTPTTSKIRRAVRDITSRLASTEAATVGGITARQILLDIAGTMSLVSEQIDEYEGIIRDTSSLVDAHDKVLMDSFPGFDQDEAKQIIDHLTALQAVVTKIRTILDALPRDDMSDDQRASYTAQLDEIRPLEGRTKEITDLVQSMIVEDEPEGEASEGADGHAT